MKFLDLLFGRDSFQVPKDYIATTNGMIALWWYTLKFSQRVERQMVQYANKQHPIGRGNRMHDARVISNMFLFLRCANCQSMIIKIIRGGNEN